MGLNPWECHGFDSRDGHGLQIPGKGHGFDSQIWL